MTPPADDHALVLPPPAPDALATLAPLLDRAQDYADAAHAPATRRAYLASWRLFEAFCKEHGLAPLPATPTTLAAYMTHVADSARRFATVKAHLAAIAHVHKRAGHPLDLRTPKIRDVRRGIARTIGTAAEGKTPCEDDLLAAMLATVPGESPRDVRDRALLTLGFFAARRRSELVALDVADVRFVKEGLRMIVRRSKTDQGGEGHRVGIPFARDPKLCAVRALQAWLDLAGLTEGAIFRPVSAKKRVLDRRLDDRTVARLVKRCALAAGVDPALYAGHSLRAGFVTTAARKGKAIDAIMRQTGHKSVAVALRYVRHATLFTQNAAADIA